MARLIFGERIGASARIRTGCSAAIFDEYGEKLLLQRRSDNGRWSLPGGGMDPGESAAEACTREVSEETGLTVIVTKLVGIYSDPNHVLEYADGNRWQIVGIHFEAERVGGQLALNEETTELAYYSEQEIEALDLMEHHRIRVRDSFAARPQAFIR